MKYSQETSDNMKVNSGSNPNDYLGPLFHCLVREAKFSLSLEIEVISMFVLSKE